MNDLTPESLGEPQPKKLYSPTQIVAATFLGSPLAGGITMAENFRNLGNEVYAKYSMQFGIFTTFVVLLLSFVLPEKTPNSLLPAVSCGLYLFLINKYQKDQISAHFEAGGAKQSHWRVVGIGIACLIGILVSLFALILLFPEWFPEE